MYDSLVSCNSQFQHHKIGYNFFSDSVPLQSWVFGSSREKNKYSVKTSVEKEMRLVVSNIIPRFEEQAMPKGADIPFVIVVI